MKKYSIPAVIIASLAIVLFASVLYGQDAACSFEVNPTEIELFDNRSSTVEIKINVVASAPSCRFTVESNYRWINVISVNQEGTTGRVLVHVEGNDTPTHRNCEKMRGNKPILFIL